MNKCAAEKCEYDPWAATPFCCGHLAEHVVAAWPEERQNEFWAKMDTVLRTLTYREREVVRLRHGLGDGYVYTLEEVAHIFKTTPENVLKIESVGIRKLQHPVRSKAMEALFEAVGFGQPPDELVKAIKSVEQKLIEYAANDPELLFVIDPRRFEGMMAELFRGFGFEVELTQQTRDGGKDIIALRGDDLGIRTKYIVECRRYAPDNPIRVGAVRALYGVKAHMLADHAILATTSRFTDDAEKFARSATVWNLHLKGLSDIAGWLEAYRQAVMDGGVSLKL